MNGSIWAMLGGTFIAVLAFAPVSLSKMQAGEFLRSLLQVIGISMMLSWVAALTVAPVLGKVMLKAEKKEGDPYNSWLFRGYRALLEGCLRNRTLTVIITLAMFGASLYMFSQMHTSFFPDAETVYFNIDLWSQEGISLAAQEKATQQLVDYLNTQPGVKNITQFVGGGGLRFMLTYSPPENNTAFSQLTVETEAGEFTRPTLMKAQAYIDEHMPETEGFCRLFARGSGMSEKIGVRFYGDDPAVLRTLRQKP